MLRRLLALVSVSFVTYLTGFLTTTAAIIFVIKGASIIDTMDALGNSMPGLLLLATTGGTVVGAVAAVKRKAIAQTTLGRWLGIVAGAGAVHIGIVAALGYVNLPVYNALTISLAVLTPPLVTGTVLFQRRTLGLRHGEQLQPPD